MGDCVSAINGLEAPFEKAKWIGKTKIETKILTTSRHGDPSWFDLFVRITTNGKSTEKRLSCSESGDPSLKWEGQSLVLTVEASSFDGEGSSTSIKRYQLNKQQTEMFLASEKTIDHVAEMYKNFKTALKSNDTDALVKSRNILRLHLNNVRDPSNSQLADIDYQTLEVFFNIANRMRKSGDVVGAGKTLTRIFNIVGIGTQDSDFQYNDLDEYDQTAAEQRRAPAYAHHTRLLNDAAFVLAKAGEFELAIRILKMVIQRDPARKVAYLNLADAAKGAGGPHLQVEALSHIAHATLSNQSLPHLGKILGCATDAIKSAIFDINGRLTVVCDSAEIGKARFVTWDQELKIKIEQH